MESGAIFPNRKLICFSFPAAAIRSIRSNGEYSILYSFLSVNSNFQNYLIAMIAYEYHLLTSIPPFAALADFSKHTLCAPNYPSTEILMQTWPSLLSVIIALLSYRRRSVLHIFPPLLDP